MKFQIGDFVIYNYASDVNGVWSREYINSKSCHIGTITRLNCGIAQIERPNGHGPWTSHVSDICLIPEQYVKNRFK